MPVSKPVQRSQNPRISKGALQKIAFRLATQNFSFFYDCHTYENIFPLFDDSVNKTKAFDLKVNYRKLKLVFVHNVNMECT